MLISGEIDSHPDAPFPALNRRLRLGVVGGGRIAATQAIAARLSDRWDVVAGAFSSDPARAKAAAADWFLPEERCYESFEAMARAEAARPDGVEAVMVTTPNHMHFPAAQAFLDAGIDVLCDKPLTNEVGEAEALVARQQETGLVFGVSYVMSCFPMIRQARELVAAGALGTINQIHVEFMQDWM
ncbi:MAG: Gfo/Idh/MocA family protein, partial [Alphaproteobacteria bacterium]